MNSFVARKVCSGPLLSLVRRSGPGLALSVVQFASGLKARAEHQA